MGNAENLDKAVSDLEKFLAKLNHKYSKASQITSLFVGKSKKRFKWKKVSLGEEFQPFANSYYYVVSERYNNAFGFELENVGTITFTATPLAFIHFSQLPAHRRKRIKIQASGELSLEQVPDYSEQEYYKDKNLFAVGLGLQSRRTKFYTNETRGIFYDFPIKCILSIGNLEFIAQGEQTMSSLGFGKWVEATKLSTETFYLYLPNSHTLLKKVKIRFEKV